ncbi:Zn-dependent alcohol dehydrogenase [Pseudomaricurvus alkylphenolicus]|uniref:Zn-dependent alcohol dehydrogenase n=1 Tax=Pseudomaricurvus alkylphenolicus TaxID=1306991 RepID=UPI00141ECB9C|nr:Zn-dependent alcohol dehydrogenase [Pseudomaricurvus alkylphenolicus]NIB38124.1 Zn-dependent alcohol dehydrogenase [Pseudomaricurvus alkylphenolicus]
MNRHRETPVTCHAAISDGRGRLSIETIEVGVPGPGEVQVQIKAAGLCHTDWDAINTWNKTFVAGHEGAGVITAVGSGVTRVQPGDRVILNWAIPCGYCHQCSEGNQHICDVNSPVTGHALAGHAHPQASRYLGRPVERAFHLGTLSEFTVVKEAAVVPIQSDIPDTSAAIIGCGVMTGYGSVVNAARVKPGSVAAVIGCGGVGLNVIQACRVAGAARIIAIDLKQDRLDYARRFGATDTILAQGDLAQMVAALKDLVPSGADYAFECTAVPQLGDAPLALIRNAGTAIQVSGIEQKVEFDCELFEWDKIYLNPLYGQCKPDIDFPRILQLYDKGQLKLDEMVSKTYGLEELAKGFDDLLSGRIAKGVVVF